MNRLSRALLTLILTLLAVPPTLAAGGGDAPRSFYDLTLRDLEGNTVRMESYRGKVLLVVNVASYCGYTPQYGGLEKLHREYAPRGFSVIGFPSNEFGAQEPGTPAEIRKFVTERFGVTFPMMEKSVIAPGVGQSPAYAFLGRSGKVPAWNFGKYLVGRDGQVIDLFPSDVTPESRKLRKAIEKALETPPPAR